MLSEVGEGNSIYHAFAAPFNKIKRAGTARTTSLIIKSGQKDTEASVTVFQNSLKKNCQHTIKNTMIETVLVI